MKMFKNKKKESFPTPKTPRTMEEILKVYSEISRRFSDTQYQTLVLKDESERLYKILRELNEEAAQRQELDKQSAAEVKPENNEAKNE